MSERDYFEHFITDEPPRLERWYCCECCGYPTLMRPNDYEFCQICDWMDDYSGDGGPGPETLPEARENFRANLTKYRPGTCGFNATELEGEHSAKRELMQAYDAYMAESDLHRRTALGAKVQRPSDNFPMGDPESGN